MAEKLWSIWQRGKVTVKNDKFFGKQETKDGQGNVVLRYWWIGLFAFGWYTPLNIQQADEAAQKAAGLVGQPTSSMTQPMPKK